MLRNITPDRRQLKTLLTIDKCRLQITRNNVFNCLLLPVGQQVAIKNSVSKCFWSTFVDSINFFECPQSGVKIILAVAWDFQQCGLCDQQKQTDQSLCGLLKYSMTVKLLTEPHLNLHLSKCHIVGNHMSQLILYGSFCCLWTQVV